MEVKMVSNISFGSTYVVKNEGNSEIAFDKFQDFILDKEGNDKASVGFVETCAPKHSPSYCCEYTAVVPSAQDSSVETFCLYHGINYSKMTNKELLSFEKIKDRIIRPKAGMRIANINAKKLEEISKNQNSNYDHCKKDYERYFANDVDYILKSGGSIPATSLYINTNGASIEDTLHYIDAYGAENLNPEQLSIDFCQRTDDPDQCVYFGLRDLGMKHIPVCVDDNTYKLCEALGLIE